MVKNLTVSNSTKYIINKREIHILVNSLTKDLNFIVESVAINFITEKEIIPINVSYLGHNYSTDIITFNYSGENYTLDGEFFISLDDASYYANKYKVELSSEIVRLIIHGFLHLVGYDDKAKEDKKEMKKIENKLVEKYFNSLTKLC